MSFLRTGWILFLAILASGISTSCASPFIKGAIPGEKGFEGAASIVEENGSGGLGYLTAEIPYLDVQGNKKMGQGRVFVRKQDLASGKPVPLLCHVHYEKDPGGAAAWCERGWAVSTAHYAEKGKGYPIDVSVGDGYNLARAVIEWARRLPFVDQSRLHIDGGSQGGYMALAMSAEFFPVTATTADAPVVNWAYNLSYFEANKPVAGYPQKDVKKSPLPILCSVMMLTDWAYGVFGNDLKSETWFRLSPISCLDQITSPVLVLCATGDMLVPMEQMTRTQLRTYDTARFPQGYQRYFDTLTVCESARKTFEECLPPERVSVQLMPLQKDSYEVTLGMFAGEEKKPGKRPEPADRPWSRDRQWSLCYLDEGPPAPFAAHTTMEWSTIPESFAAEHQKAQPPLELLTPAKLERLLERYAGQTKNAPLLASGKPANRLNFPECEKRDVISGLLAYARLGDEYAARLQSLYAQMPLKPLGENLDLASLQNSLAASPGS